MLEPETPTPPSDPGGSGIDATTPHSARIWDYWLGGKDNYAVDREAGDQYLEVFPSIHEIAQQDRAFLAQAVEYLSIACGMRQFLDIGTGLPTADNTHQVVHRFDRAARVVYVDNDPLVLAHARALLTDIRALTTFLDADLHEPEEILRQADKLLDLSKPVAIMFIGTIGYADSATAKSLVQRLMGGVASGSYLALNQAINNDAEWVQTQDAYNSSGATPYYMYEPTAIAELFTGLELVGPGLVSCPEWHPAAQPSTAQTEASMLAALGRKP